MNCDKEGIRNKERVAKNTVTSSASSLKSKKKSGSQNYYPKMSINPCKLREKMSYIGKQTNKHIYTHFQLR